ncbi:MAG: hypothetical protein E7253_00870 [Lachnospiraceae bacterium]|nr:hypothetical protein [Lachnospiraceae bacterium]
MKGRIIKKVKPLTQEQADLLAKNYNMGASTEEVAKKEKDQIMPYQFPFGQKLNPLIQEDMSPKKVFVLGVYASAVHARWKKNGQIVCQALVVASEPRIFWDGNPEEAKEIIDEIHIPAELGHLEPAGRHLNGPSAKVLHNNILAPLGYTRADAWLCDCLPETRLNPSQEKVIRERYNPLIERYGLNPVTIPKRPSVFCNLERSKEITKELMQSEAEILILLGDIPISQYLNKVADVSYSTLGEYVEQYGYGNPTEAVINGKTIKILPLAHPRQIGALGAHSEKWNRLHQEWEQKKIEK